MHDSPARCASPREQRLAHDRFDPAPSVLKSRARAAPSICATARSSAPSHGQHRRHGTEVQLDLPRRREDRRLDRLRAVQPLRIDRLHQLLDPRFAAAGQSSARGDASERRRRDAAAGRRPQQCSIGRISRGGPGSSAIALAVVLDPEARRGAVRIRQHGRAARHLRLAPIDLGHLPAALREALLDRRDDAGSSSSGRPSASATTSRVRSSSVGPRPPVRITRSSACSACTKCARSSARSSPTIALKATSMPRPFSTSVMVSELVSVRVGVSSSLPTAMIAALRLMSACRARSNATRAAPGTHRPPRSRRRA